MSLTINKITELAPDQESLNAANKLKKRNNWPTLTKNNELVWGECQGSGANPYRTVFDNSNAGYKCTCPSRKFPCKHVLALMWMYVDDPSPFADGELPTWVTDWLGRRRSSDNSASSEPKEAKAGTLNKSLIAAMVTEPEKAVDPKVEARRKSHGRAACPSNSAIDRCGTGRVGAMAERSDAWRSGNFFERCQHCVPHDCGAARGRQSSSDG